MIMSILHYTSQEIKLILEDFPLVIAKEKNCTKCEGQVRWSESKRLNVLQDFPGELRFMLLVTPGQRE